MLRKPPRCPICDAALPRGVLAAAKRAARDVELNRVVYACLRRNPLRVEPAREAELGQPWVHWAPLKPREVGKPWQLWMLEGVWADWIHGVLDDEREQR